MSIGQSKFFAASLITLIMSMLPAAADAPLSGVFPESVKVIAIVAPGSPASDSSKVDLAIKHLTAAGKKVKVMPNARKGEPCKNYSSIAPELRIADIEQAWMDPEVDLILCIRGGAGTAQIVQNINWDKLRRRPDMPVLGFSDITALHLAMLKERAGHPVCAPSLTALLRVDSASKKSVMLGLSGRPRPDMQLEVLTPGHARGMILAGHLRLLKEMNQTRFQADTTGKVIFIECPDLNEVRAADALENLRKSGFFDHCAAVVFGRLSNCRKNERQVKQKFAQSVKCPVFDGFPYSHTARNHLLDMRKKVEISADGIFKFL